MESFLNNCSSVNYQQTTYHNIYISIYLSISLAISNRQRERTYKLVINLVMHELQLKQGLLSLVCSALKLIAAQFTMAETFHRTISSLICTTKRNLKLSKTFLSSFLNPSSHQRFHPRDRYGYSIIFLLWGACKFSNLVATLFATTKGFNENYYFYYSYSIITNRKAPNSIILHTTDQ